MSKEESNFKQNERGYVLYPKNHLGRDINILKAIILLDAPTALAISEAVGSTKATVARTIQRLNNEALVCIESTDNKGYVVKKWGGIFTKKNVLSYDELLALRLT